MKSYKEYTSSNVNATTQAASNITAQNINNIINNLDPTTKGLYQKLLTDLPNLFGFLSDLNAKRWKVTPAETIDLIYKYSQKTSRVATPNVSTVQAAAPTA